MSIVNKIIREIFRTPSTKKLLFASVFTLALAGSAALGIASRGMSSAAEDRDCSVNSIDYKAYPAAGQCGAANPAELIKDIQHNDPSDCDSLSLSAAEFVRVAFHHVSRQADLRQGLGHARVSFFLCQSGFMHAQSFGHDVAH